MLRDDLLPCDIASGGSDVDCVGSVIEEMDAGQKKCQCNVECEELDYQLSISQALWPSNQYEVRIQYFFHNMCLKYFALFLADTGNGIIWL